MEVLTVLYTLYCQYNVFSIFYVKMYICLKKIHCPQLIHISIELSKAFSKRSFMHQSRTIALKGNQSVLTLAQTYFLMGKQNSPAETTRAPPPGCNILDRRRHLIGLVVFVCVYVCLCQYLNGGFALLQRPSQRASSAQYSCIQWQK